jgi:glycerol uptake facilitator-like aquaporin
MLAASNLVLRFLLELAGLAALGYVGFQLFDGPVRWVTAFAAPSVLALTWALVVAPNASNGLPPSVRELIGSALLLAVALGLALAGQSQPATVFAALVVVNTVFLVVLGQAGTSGTEVAR